MALAHHSIRALTVVVLTLAGLRVDAGPVPPCGATGSGVVPPYAEPGDPPTIGIWRNVELARAHSCLGALRGSANLAVVFAARFGDARSIEDIAGRVGAMSSTKGFRYWSNADGKWRTLVSDAFALASRDADSRRADFTPDEILSGRTLYFAQRDTRSTSLNIYSLTGRMIGPRRLAIEMINLTAIRFLVFTLFEPNSLRSLHIFEMLGPNLWGYYGISTVHDDAVEGHEISLVNRAAAAYRFFRIVPADRDPPLAP